MVSFVLVFHTGGKKMDYQFCGIFQLNASAGYSAVCIRTKYEYISDKKVNNDAHCIIKK